MFQAMAETKFFKSQLIAERTIRIQGPANDNAYLVEGDNYALLIDTTIGAGKLREFCGELTSLSIHVVLTHGHADHFGGCFEFGECYIHPDDMGILYFDLSLERRIKFIENMNGGSTFVKLSDLVPPCPLRTYPVYDGDFFDLGNRRIEVIGVPGHSSGTLVFYDPLTRILFSGDACNTNTLLYLPGSTSIKQYLQSLLRLQKREGDFDYLWGGHGGEALSPRLIAQAIGLCNKILDGADAAVEGGVRDAPFYYAKPRARDMSANIAYRKDWIHEAPSYRRPPLNGGVPPRT
jgi:glyoxylase-like metal-dependent hydrolase (beta-lactamase superfamily II)